MVRIDDIVEWILGGASLGEVAVLLIVLYILRDRLFKGRVDLRTLDDEFRKAEKDNKEAHQALNVRIGAVRDDTQYMRGVLDTLKERVRGN